MGTNYGWEMCKISNVLSSLAQGKGSGLSPYKEVQNALYSVGIKEGHFKIDAGAGTHSYFLRKDGSVFKVDDSIID